MQNFFLDCVNNLETSRPSEVENLLEMFRELLFSRCNSVYLSGIIKLLVRREPITRVTGWF
nr:MAG TPA: hypothetical protein [Caudoviricetes sp.]